jgi:hypothetical protein
LAIYIYTKKKKKKNKRENSTKANDESLRKKYKGSGMRRDNVYKRKR